MNKSMCIFLNILALTACGTSASKSKVPQPEAAATADSSAVVSNAEEATIARSSCDFNFDGQRGRGTIVALSENAFVFNFVGTNGRKYVGVSSAWGRLALVGNCRVRFKCDLNNDGQNGTAIVNTISDSSWNGIYIGQNGRRFATSGNFGDGQLRNCALSANN